MSGEKKVTDNRERLEKVAQKAVDGVMRRGASGVRARAGMSRSVSLAYREGRPERVEESRSRSLTLWLFVDGRYTTCETNNFAEDELEKFIDTSLRLARSVEVDPDRQLPDPELYLADELPGEEELELYDASMSEIGSEERHRIAAEIESEVRDRVDGERVLSVEAKYEDSEGASVLINSNGFIGRHRGTQRWGMADVSLRDGEDRRPSGWAVAGSRSRTGLASAESIARGAIAAAEARVGGVPIETAKLPMVVENRAVGRLLRYLLGALDGRALQQRSSFLEGKRGDRVGSEVLDIVDDPFIVQGFSSRRYDGEGIAARRMPLFQKGVLQNYFINTYYGRKLGERPTTGGGSNIVVTPGQRDFEELIGDIDRGVLVRGFIGGNSNPTTGDFSLGVYGTLIESGQLGAAVAEMNIAGNHLDLWRRLEGAGSDVYPYSSVLSPSLRFDSIQFAGK